MEQQIELVTRWKKETLVMKFPPSATLLDVKQHIWSLTRILPSKQKLLGLMKQHEGGGRSASSIHHNNHNHNDDNNHDDDDDKITLQALNLKTRRRQKFILMGTPESDQLTNPSVKPIVVNDLDASFTMHSKEWQSSAANHVALHRITTQTSIHVIHPPREYKKLLVLDLDHTLVDFRGCFGRHRRASTRTISEHDDIAPVARPHMHEFLRAVFAHYDLAIWSQTQWNWLELKLTELNMLTHHDYHICFVLDITSMFPYHSFPNSIAGDSSTKSKRRRRHVKPLQVIWDHFQSRWNASNTLHIDDLQRNFAMNPANGIRIEPYYRHEPNALQDKELLQLANYLNAVCHPQKDVTTISHENWKMHQGPQHESNKP